MSNATPIQGHYDTSSVFVAVIGRPNVGKSSLTNLLVGEKVAIVTSKPQTTRTRITGVITRGPLQYVLLDTPGVHKARNKPMPTDVLSFPLGVDGKYDVDENNGCKMLGDIVISMERAQEQANLYGHPLQREVAFLTVHSMLHLLGYDHENGGLEAMRMREKEEAVLLQLGLPRTVSYTE